MDVEAQGREKGRGRLGNMYSADSMQQVWPQKRGNMLTLRQTNFSTREAMNAWSLLPQDTVDVTVSTGSKGISNLMESRSIKRY